MTFQVNKVTLTPPLSKLKLPDDMKNILHLTFYKKDAQPKPQPAHLKWHFK